MSIKNGLLLFILGLIFNIEITLFYRAPSLTPLLKSLIKFSVSLRQERVAERSLLTMSHADEHNS